MMRLFRRDPAAAEIPARPRLRASAVPAVIYAIGDVHGCIEALRDMERQMIADAAGIAGEKWLVMLGDYIDRGPASAQVVDHLIAPPPEGFRRICLAGNHEAFMVAFFRDSAANPGWLDFGAPEALASYGMPAEAIERVRADPRRGAALASAYVPAEHLRFLEGLPASFEAPGYVFVHAGLRPGIALADQSEDDLLWYRDRYADSYESFGRLVVHGHTPREEPFVGPFRLGLDTGVYSSGVLSGARLQPGRDPVLFFARVGVR